MGKCSYTWKELDPEKGKYVEKRCPEENRESSDEFCIFHDPSPEKDVNLFRQKMEEKTDCNFRGYFFPEGWNFQNKEFHEDADFKGAAFQGKADFREATFQGKADFKGVIILGEANLSRTTFQGNVDFGKAAFRREANLSRTTFQGNVDFGKAAFRREAYFGKAAFRREAYFRKAAFQENADFNGATFQENADFNGATFKIAYFRKATFKIADFREATFQGITDFREATFQDADFRGSVFKKYASFGGVTFQIADFREVTFQKANFSAIRAKESFEFNPRKVSGIIDFQDAKFFFSGSITVDLERIKLHRTHLQNVTFVHCEWPDNYIIFEENEMIKEELSFNELESIYRNLKQNMQNHGDYTTAGNLYYREMEMRRKGTKTKKKRLWLELYRILAGYGEKPQLVIRNSFLVILLAAVFFFFWGVARVGAEVSSEEDLYIIDYSLHSLNFSMATIKDFGYCMYYSVVTFTTLGYGDIHPLGSSHFLASAEALTGAFFMALFVVVFARKMMR